jgi:hypothetical protein
MKLLLGLYWPTEARRGPLGKMAKPESQQQKCGLWGAQRLTQNGTRKEMKWWKKSRQNLCENTQVKRGRTGEIMPTN